MRPIDADELIDSIKDDLYDRAGYWYRLIADALINLIQSMPTLGSEPDQNRDDDIVRCTRCGTYVPAEEIQSGICSECREENAAADEWLRIDQILDSIMGGDTDD